jgi:thiol-disulfide isomerase/thioredoxin
VDASDDDFASVAGSAPVPVVIDFWGRWCAPSRRLNAVFEQLARALAGRAKLVRVDVEETPQLIKHYGVQGLPTLLVMHRGRAIARMSGTAQAHDRTHERHSAGPRASGLDRGGIEVRGEHHDLGPVNPREREAITCRWNADGCLGRGARVRQRT